MDGPIDRGTPRVVVAVVVGGDVGAGAEFCSFLLSWRKHGRTRSSGGHFPQTCEVHQTQGETKQPACGPVGCECFRSHTLCRQYFTDPGLLHDAKTAENGGFGSMSRPELSFHVWVIIELRETVYVEVGAAIARLYPRFVSRRQIRCNR